MREILNKISDFLKGGKWNCTSCGACCSYIKPLTDNGKLPSYWARPDGSCINLKDKKCLIYGKRPSICRIDVTLKPYSSDLEIARMCKTMLDFMELKKDGN